MAEPETLSVRRLNRATLARQLLLVRQDVRVADAVRRLGGLQAQEPRPPFVALWARLEGFERQSLVGALRRRTVVRATAMRATLHLLHRDDARALRPALQPMLAETAARVAKARRATVDVDAVLPAAHGLLAQRPRTFNELRPLLAEAFPGMEERSLGYAVRMHLPLVMVPTGDPWGYPADTEFALADEALGGPVPTEPDPAADERLVLLHLSAFGPAAVADVQTWSGRTGLKDVFERLRPNLAVFRDERRRTLFDLPDAPRPDEDVPAPARLLPEFDSLVLAHKDRTRVVPEQHRAKLTTKNLRIPATFLVDGVVAGTWTMERKRDTATLTLAPFAKLPVAAARELKAEGEALLRFTDGDDVKGAVRVV